MPEPRISASADKAVPRKMTVFFNGGCDICAPEVGVYQRHAIAAGRDFIEFVDISPDVREGRRDDIFLKRFHVETDAQMLIGVDAFIHLWRELPRFRWLAGFVAFPPIHLAAKIIYNRVLAPVLYRRYINRLKK
jgi:predicted DCC family thiol-disulfide oxidoreductase YuxK